MNLEGEELPKIYQVSQLQVEAAFDESQTDFGKFIILDNATGGFIQSANLWEPTEECQRFLKERDSDPYCLEYRNEATGELFAADGWFTLKEIKEAFLEYLRGHERWKENKTWNQIEY